MSVVALASVSRAPTFVHYFAGTFVGLSVVFFAIWSGSLYLSVHADNRTLQVSVADAVHAERVLIEDTLERYAGALGVAAALDSLSRYIGGGAPGPVTSDFTAFVREKAEIAQLRFIDSVGAERIRVDRSLETGQPIVITELQNKADRYYFREAFGLPAGGIYISAIDLNVEFGAVEVPWRPMIRLATPVADASGTIVGVVVMNLALNRLLDTFERRGFAAETRMQLLNPGGFWLAGVPKEMRWGFMFDRGTTMEREDPEAWTQIAFHPEGHRTLDGRTVIHETVDPRNAVLRNGREGILRTEDRHWKVAAIVPGVTFRSIWQDSHYVAALAGILVIGAISYILASAVTLRREAEKASRRAARDLERSERMASLGSLVAGVAHELNTPVGTAVTVASTLSERADAFREAVASGDLRRSVIDRFLADMQEGTRIILDGLDRAQELIGHFKQVAVDQASDQRRRFRIAEFVGDIVASLNSQFRHGNIELKSRVDSTAELDGFPGPLSQVLINLVANARIHGYPDGAAGAVEIVVRNAGADALEIEVRDDGKGMPPKVLERIFEPFFTTAMGQGGSGLGLSIVYNIVTGPLGGTIRAESEPGTGTAVFITLPLNAPRTGQNATGRIYDVE